MNRTASLATALSFAAFGSALFAAPQTETITESEVRAHLDFLASDLLEGRDSGYRGGELAAAYLESQLVALGLKPLFDTFQMSFELRGAASRSKVRMRVGDAETEATDPALLEAIAASALGEFRAPVVTAATDDPSGKIVIASGGDDASAAESTAKSFFERGAAGVVFVTAKDKFEVRERRDGRRRQNPKSKSEAATDGAKSDTPAGGGYLTQTDAWMATHSSGASVVFGGPVVRVARELGGDLLDAIDRGAQVELAVTREGVDRSTNVIGWLEGSDPALRDEYVVIGAHYDHVGFDDHGNIWNGADDNASGTVSVLEIAEAFATIAPPKRSMVFCFWGAEERGLVGSEAFVRGKRLEPESVAAYVNLDMVGRNDANAIFGLQASKDLFDLAGRCGATHGLDVTTGAEMFLNASDSGPFIAAKVPTLFFFSGLHDQYHTPADDPGTVDYAKITKVARTAHDMLRDLADSSTRPKFSEANTSRPPENRRRLGIFPNDEAPGEGVAIRAVTKGGVAAKAGILDGDRIVKVGDTVVANMNAMREALAAQAEGTPFPIEVVRSGAKVVCTAVFEKPEDAKTETKN